MSASTPTHFAVIFDYSSKTFRNELYPEYKANRSAPPEDLIPQFGLIRQATRAFNLPCIEMEGFEADDLIATYARLAREAGADATIISSDKDLMQLVGATVSMYDPMKDRQIGIPEVIEKWGVPPEKMIDLQALTGDSVDNVPGVPGIGPKTAAQLLEQFGDLDTLLARAGEIKQDKRRAVDHRQRRQGAHFARTGDAEERRAGDRGRSTSFVLQPPNGPKLIAFLKAMEFTTLTRRVAEATGTEAGEIEPAIVPVERGDGAWAGCRRRCARRRHRRRTRPRTAVGEHGDAAASRGGRAADGGDTPAAACRAARRGGGCGKDRHQRLCRHPRPRHAEGLDRRGDARRASSPSTPRPPRSIRCRPSWSASRCATAPGRAAYVPLGHKTGRGDLLGGGLAGRTRSRCARRSPR